MGTVLFTDASARAVTDVRMDRVAYYTLVHFAVFGILGGVIAVLLRQVELHSKHPGIVLASVFVILEVLFVFAAAILMPGDRELGFVPVESEIILQKRRAAETADVSR